MGLKILWLEPNVLFKGKGVITVWGEVMELKGWEIIRDASRWEECDLIFFGSESQLKPELIGKKPTICYFWGWPPERFLLADFRKVAEQRLDMVARCTRVLVPTPTVAEQVAQFGIECQPCLPGIDIKLVDSVPEQVRDPRVVFISRLVDHKNLQVLINAMSLIRPKIGLLVLGPGDRSPYQDLAKKLEVDISFDEPDDAGKIMALKKSAMLVHPSRYEGFGMPPLEALACHTPVIALDTPLMRWLLEENAYYFQTEEDLAEKIVYVFNNIDEAMQKARGGEAKVRYNVTLDHACDRLWAHIHQTIKSHLGVRIRTEPEKTAEIYDIEHRRNWEYAANRFDPTWARHWRAQYFIKLLRECKAQNIIDIGSGAVYPTIFAKEGFNITALDISKEALSQVREIANKWNVSDKVVTVQGDANFLPYKDNVFDAALQAEIWEHVKEPRKMISEGLRVIKPGGYLIASTPVAHEHYDPMHIGPIAGGWDSPTLSELLEPWKSQIKLMAGIAEGGDRPSCFLIVLEKK